ncbi:2-dehydropantoate 2-reductase [Streptomyces sp. NPDC056296]|uniref:2-dehydropantoate 2-reductase n=1 Tax=Streptomyces sp. NPDC056296 TaxID=3345775 RepID=UPI0035D6BD97
MKVAVLGAGAIGAYVGAALHRAGADVHLIARGPHLAAMRRYGVRVRSPRGDFTAHTRATDDPAEVGPVDYVFLGLKANSYAACGPLIEPLPHDTTAVVAAQNGIPWWYFHRHGGPYDGRRLQSVDPSGAVSAVLAPERAVGCVVYAATELEQPGVVRHLEGTRFSIGEPGRDVSARCLALSEAMRSGGLLLGGAAGGFVRPDELDIPLTFEGTRQAGPTLGSGVVMAFDDTVPLLRVAEFFRDESCGQCVPCRVGTVRQEEALRRIVEHTGAAAADDITLLREVGRAMRDASICGLGQTAWNAVESAIDRLGAYE